MGNKNKKCPDCGKPIWDGSAKCKSCAHKVERGSYILNGNLKDILHQMYVVQQMPIAHIARELNLTSIFYHIKRFGFPKRQGKWAKTPGIASEGWVHNGYRFVQYNDREIQEHRLIIEQELGRPLTNKEVVHHIDCNPLNNSRDNLQLMSKGAHSTLHDTGKCRRKSR